MKQTNIATIFIKMGTITSKCQACEETFTLKPPVNDILKRCYICEAFYSRIERDTRLLFSYKQNNQSYIGNIHVYTPKTHIYLKSKDMKILVPKGIYIIVGRCRNGGFSFHLPEVVVSMLPSLDIISLLRVQEQWWNMAKCVIDLTVLQKINYKNGN